MRIVEDGRGLTDYWGAFNKLREIGLDCKIAVGIVTKLKSNRGVASLTREFVGVVPGSITHEIELEIIAVIRQRPSGEWDVDKRSNIVGRAFLDQPLSPVVSTAFFSFMKKSAEGIE